MGYSGLTEEAKQRILNVRASASNWRCGTQPVVPPGFNPVDPIPPYVEPIQGEFQYLFPQRLKGVVGSQNSGVTRLGLNVNPRRKAVENLIRELELEIQRLLAWLDHDADPQTAKRLTNERRAEIERQIRALIERQNFYRDSLNSTR